MPFRVLQQGPPHKAAAITFCVGIALLVSGLVIRAQTGSGFFWPVYGPILGSILFPLLWVVRHLGAGPSHVVLSAKEDRAYLESKHCYVMCEKRVWEQRLSSLVAVERSARTHFNLPQMNNIRMVNRTTFYQHYLVFGDGSRYPLGDGKDAQKEEETVRALQQWLSRNCPEQEVRFGDEQRALYTSVSVVGVAAIPAENEERKDGDETNTAGDAGSAIKAEKEGAAEAIQELVFDLKLSGDPGKSAMGAKIEKALMAKKEPMVETWERCQRRNASVEQSSMLLVGTADAVLSVFFKSGDALSGRPPEEILEGAAEDTIAPEA